MKKSILIISLICLFSAPYDNEVSALDTVKFAMIGDFGTGGSGSQNVANLINSWGVQFITTVGDNRYGTINYDVAVGKHYCAWLKNAGTGTNCNGGGASINKFFPVTGNHDYDDGGGINEYLSYFTLPGTGIATTNTSGNERYYDIIKGDVHFFMIDSENALNNSSDRTAQKNWLQARLAASTAKWKIVCFHHASYSSGSHGSNTTMQWPFAAWGADLVLTGHDHTYERIHRDGIVYLVNGLGGNGTYAFGSTVSGSQVRYNSNYGASRITIYGDTLNLKFINISGTVIDNYTIINSVAPCAPISSDGFESGFGAWIDGGSDAARKKSYPNTGQQSIELKDNSGAASSMYTNNINLASDTQVRVAFSFYAVSFETGEDFMLEKSTDGGTTYSVVQSWIFATDFSNTTRYNKSVTIPGSFSSNTRFRIRCDASDDNDKLYIDDVVVTTCAPTPDSRMQRQETSDEIEKRIDVHPNPVSGILNIELVGFESNAKLMTLYNIEGVQVAKQMIHEDHLNVDVSNLKDGIYIVHILDESGEPILSERVVVQH